MRRSSAVPLAAIRRILVRCPNWLGDTVMALPTLRALRAALPEAELWCQGPWVEALLDDDPAVARRLGVPGDLAGRAALARALRRAGIDLVLLLPNSFETALWARLAGVRWRVGYAADGRSALLTHAVPPEDGLVHQVAAYLRLLTPLGIDAPVTPPTVHVRATRRAQAESLLAEVGVAPGDVSVALQLGAALGPSKLWASERLAELAMRLEARGIRAVLLGSHDAAALAARIARGTTGGLRSLVGRDDRTLLPALLSRFDAVVAADTGPAHLAAAVGAPTVTLFGPTDPRLSAPLGAGARVIWRQPPCAPCFARRCPIDHRCLASLTVDEVLATVLTALGRTTP